MSIITHNTEFNEGINLIVQDNYLNGNIDFWYFYYPEKIEVDSIYTVAVWRIKWKV